MEVLQHTSSRTDNLDNHVPQLGEPGWLPPSLSALQQSNDSKSELGWLHPSFSALQQSISSESRETAWLPPSLSALKQSSSGSDSGEVGPFPPALVSDFLQSSSTSESGNPKCDSFELRCLANLSKGYLAVPPPHAPARAISGLTKPSHVLRASPKAILELSKRFASGALEHYNEGKKDKFELVDAMPVIMMPESGRRHTHVNFTAKSSKEGSPEKLFFAELHNCGKLHARSGFIVTFCKPLGSDTTVGHKGFELDTKPQKSVDFTRCFGCTPRIIHPKRGYIAGHCTIPYAYDSRC